MLPRIRDLLPQLRLDMCWEMFVREELLLAARHIFDFHSWPLVAKQECHARAQFFGSLKLPGDLGWCERVIDSVPALAKSLDLHKRVGTTFFLRDHGIDVDLAIGRD